MKKICLLLFFILSLMLLTSCTKSEKISVFIKPIESNKIDKKQEEKESVKKTQQEINTENIQPLEKQESIQDVEFEEETEEEVLATEEKEEILTEDIVQATTNKTLIASGMTEFNPNQVERSSNIRLAASFINNLVLYPGDEFSFNNVVGKRTKERGFLPADIIVGGSVAKGYGGGVCQTSSTVCAAVRQTSMKILEQNPHSKRVTYTTIDNEAMINYGTSDFRFLNVYDKPVIIEISFERNGDREAIKCNLYLLE